MAACRICLGGQEEGVDPADVLIDPCACRGSMQAVHISCHELWQACRRCSQREACEVCGQGYTLPAGYAASVRQLVSSGKLLVPSNPLQQLLDRVQGSLEPMWVLLSCWLNWCAQQAAAGEQMGRDWASSLQEVAAELAPCPRPSNRRTAADWATEACKYNLALEAELSRLMTRT